MNECKIDCEINKKLLKYRNTVNKLIKYMERQVDDLSKYDDYDGGKVSAYMDIMEILKGIEGKKIKHPNIWLK